MSRALLPLLFLVLWTACSPTGAQPRSAGGPFAVVATDVHELAPSLHDEGAAWRKFVTTGAGRDIVHTESILDAFDRDLEALGPRWLLITGDLTNNGEKASHLALAARLARIQARGTRVLVIPGNHDVNNPWARAFRGDHQVVTDTVGPGEFASIYRDFGYGQADSRDPASLSYRVNAAPGLWFLMLDTAEYDQNATYGQPTTNGRVAAATLAWIEDQATQAARAHARIVVCQHHSLVDHTSVLSQGFTLDNAPEVQALYARLGIHLVFSGHIHTQSIASATVAGATLYDVATNALSVYPHQFGVVTLDPNSRASVRTRGVDVDGWARATGQRDPQLLGFAKWAEADFADQGRALARGPLAGLDPKVAAQAADTLALLNLHLFAGRQDQNAGLEKTVGYRALADADGFVGEYVKAIVSSPLDNNRLDCDY